MINPLMPNGLFYRYPSDRYISYIKSVWLVNIITMFDRNSGIIAVASDLGLHCLLMSLLWALGKKMG